MDFDRDRDENTPYTISDIARELHMGPEYVRLAIKRGALPARKVLGRWLVTAEDFRRVRAGEPLPKQIQDMKALKTENERLMNDLSRLGWSMTDFAEGKCDQIHRLHDRPTSLDHGLDHIEIEVKHLRSELAKLRADNERLRSHAANIKHLMDGPAQIENTTIWAELCKMVDQ
jgi:hypothetical protein